MSVSVEGAWGRRSWGGRMLGGKSSSTSSVMEDDAMACGL